MTTNIMDTKYGAGYMRQGALPVIVSIPRAGMKINFTKFMVLGEKPSVRMWVYPEWIARFAKYVFLTILFLLGAALIGMSPVKSIFRSPILGLVIAALLPLAFIFYFNQTLFWIGLCVTVVAGIVMRAVNKRKTAGPKKSKAVDKHTENEINQPDA